jgi:uncharacterized protein YeaO (DUF488 family)
MELRHWRVPVRTKRWNDPVEPDDGFRLLICLYRPRGVRKEDELWNGWASALAPSRELHAAAYGKSAPPLPFDEYARRFREEIERRPSFWIKGLADSLRRGDTITLLCSSACTDAARCHRTLVKAMIEAVAFPPPAGPVTTIVRRRRV